MSMRTRAVCGVLAAALFTQLTACGSLFYPERRGQITGSGRIDPGIVALDAIGLLFYIIPGLVAFGVDFATGAIYLPENRRAEVDPAELNKAVNPDGSVDRARLKAIIQQATGHNLPLDDPRLLQRSGNTEQLASLGLAPRA